MRGTRTLMPESAAPGATGDLPARRLSLWLQACILEGTRWTGLTSGGPVKWQQVRNAGRGFPGDRRGERRIRADRDEERCFVICDERSTRPSRSRRGAVACCLVSPSATRLNINPGS